MRAGKRDKRIVLENPTETQGSMGGQTQTWAELDTVWAEKRDMGGREYLAAGGKQLDADALFIILYLSGVTEKTRISCDGRYYDIMNIKAIGRDKGLELMAKART